MRGEKWVEAAVYAIDEPPNCIKEFKATPKDPEQEDRPSAFLTFELGCSRCGAGEFQLTAFPLVAPDPSPYYGVSPGETLQRPPHRLECSSCGHSSVLFDLRRHGYDGVLGHGSGYETGGEGEEEVPLPEGPFSIEVTFGFSIEMDELREIAEEAGISPSDLFDWITITGKPANDGIEFELDYECA